MKNISFTFGYDRFGLVRWVAILFSIVTISINSLSASENYPFVTKWGSYGSGNGQFNYPTGVAVNASGNVYVAERGNSRIQKFSSDGTFITKWGSHGSGDGQFNYPRGVAVDTSGNVYVTEWGGSDRIQKFSSDGTFITKWGSGGSGDGQFSNPLGVAVDTSDNVYVADFYNNRIQKFSSSGTFINKWGSQGSGDGQFYYPQGVAVDTSGNVYVIEANYENSNLRVQKFSSDGTFIIKWGSYGSGDGQFSNPKGIAVDTSNNVYVVEPHRVQKFSSDGTFITKWGSYGTGDGQFGGPIGIAVDTSGNVYVVDYDNNNIQKFSIATPTPTPSPTPTFSDTTAPTGFLNINSGASYTNSTTVTLNLSATDSVGVTGYYISETLSYPSASASGWVSVASTTSYSANVSYSFSGGDGSKTVYVWYKDAAGNVSTAYAHTITLDTTSPTVIISSPTSGSTYTATSSTISLGGSASDNSSGISSVSWSNSRGGNGTATGTASWSVSSISLSTGDNVITVTAKDGANNSGTDTLQVTYSGGTTVSVPTVSTGSASSVTTSSATLNGTVNANGGTTTAWFNYGTTSGSYTGTSSTQTVTGSSNTTVSIGITGLSSGTNYYYRIAAQNSAGTSYGSEASFTTSSAATPTPTPTPSTSDTTAPTVTITSPTSGSTYTTTSSAITLSGTASDNSGSISSVKWSNSKGGSGTASGTTSWTISGISLSSGENVITVTATDGSGNSGTDTITVTYNATNTQPPTVTTGSATNITSSSATLNGTVNPNGLSTTAWFEYGTVTGTYGNKSSTQSVSGSSTTSVSANISGLSANTKCYYRIAAENSAGTSYGSEGNFTTEKAAVTPTPTPSPTLPPIPTPTITVAPTLPPLPSPTPAQESIVFGFVNDEDDQPLKWVTVTIERVLLAASQGENVLVQAASQNQQENPPISPFAKGGHVGSNVGANGGSPSQQTETDEDGYYEFGGLEAGEYAVTYEKDGYETQTQDISLEDGEAKDLGVVILEQIERGKMYGYAVNINGDPIEFVRVKLRGIKTKVTRNTSSDADGFFEFADLDADTYVIVAKKRGYRKTQQKVTLDEGESMEIEIVMKKTSKRVKELFLKQSVQ